jgi:hypothetical protein
MILDYHYYREVLCRIKKPVFAITIGDRFESSNNQSLESFMSYGFGSGANGTLLTEIPCSNAMDKGVSWNGCSNVGLMVCSQVRLRSEGVAMNVVLITFAQCSLVKVRSYSPITCSIASGFLLLIKIH